MYSKKIEGVIDAAVLVGVITDKVRNTLRSMAEAEGENVDEVIAYANQRMIQDVLDSISTSDTSNLHNDILNDFMNVEKESEYYISRGYQVYHADKQSLDNLESRINSYNLRAAGWGFLRIEWSSAMKIDMVFYAKFEEIEGFNPDTYKDPIMFEDWEKEILSVVEVENRRSYMQNLYNDIIRIAKPFNQLPSDNQPTHPQTKDANNIVGARPHKSMSTKISEARSTQLIVPMSAISKVCKLIDGYNKKASKWGYELLTLNSDNTISGKFTPKNNASGFWGGMKEAYKNGDLEEEWKKILKLCGVE